MYRIKQLPEDFKVREISELKLGNNGAYSYFLLKKRNYNTLRAVETIADKLGISKKSIGFAGNKDKNAVTEQVISIKGGNESIGSIALKDIELKFIGKGNEEIYLGSHKANEFLVTIRNLTDKEIRSIENKIGNNKILMPNYFGPQRFSNNNAEIGKSIIKKDFKKAINLILAANSDYKEKIKGNLEKRPNDFVVALKLIPLKLLKLYIHSYQSLIFNKTLGQCIKHKGSNEKLKNGNEKFPIVGFGTELGNGKIGGIIGEILEKEGIGLRDFIIRQVPELSSEGTERSAFIKISDFKIAKKEKDELNKNGEKITVKFSLPKGCYATVLIENLLG